MENTDIKDPTKEGVGGLKGVNTKVSKYRDIDYGLSASPSEFRQRRTTRDNSPISYHGDVNVGQSRYDKELTSISDLENIGDLRAEEQPWYNKIGAGLVKGTVLAGTTFLDGTIGLIYGAGAAIKEGKVSQLWDNPINQSLKEVNDNMEKALPNYYTKHEQENPWSHVFSANFIGDKFIKNLGFTVGAFYSGGLATIPVSGATKLAMMSAKRLGATYSTLKTMSKAEPIVRAVLGSSISALNEGRIEAINNSSDWYKYQKEKLDAAFSERMALMDQYKGSEMYPDLIKTIESQYNEALTNLAQERAKMGNVDMMLNYPILMVSNLAQFGRLYANGFKTAKRTTKILEQNGKFIVKPNYGIQQALIAPLAEGTEEISQRAASTVSGKYYEDRVENMYKLSLDPDAQQKTVNWMKASAEGINETLNDGSAWEEFFIGSLTGALGMPSFRGMTNKETGKKQSPIYFRGGIVGGIKDAVEEKKNREEMASSINKRIQDPEFINYYQGLVRRNKLQGVMDAAAQNSDEFSFKNAEHAQLLSDIIMFDNAGKIDYLQKMINEGSDVSPENLQKIREMTSTEVTNEDGTTSIVSPFIDEKGNAMSDEDMSKKITDNKKAILNAIEDYSKIKLELENVVPKTVKNEEFAELVWLKHNIKNWNDRSEVLLTEIQDKLKILTSLYSELRNVLEEVRREEGQKPTINPDGTKVFNVTDKYNELTERIKNIDNIVTALSFLTSSKNPSILNTKEVKPLRESLEKDSKNLLEAGFGNTLSSDYFDSLYSKWDDLMKLQDGISQFNTKLSDYIRNPKKISSDIAQDKQKIQNEELLNKHKAAYDSLQNVKTLKEFSAILDSIEDEEVRNLVIDKIDKEGSDNIKTLNKNYKNINTFKEAVNKAINELEYSPKVRTNALKLFKQHIDNVETLEEASNINSTNLEEDDTIYDDTLSDEDNLNNFEKAQYAVLRAIYKVTSDNKYKAMFTNIVTYPLAERIEFETSTKNGIITTKIIAYRAGDGQVLIDAGIIVDKSIANIQDKENIDAISLLELTQDKDSYKGKVVIRYKDNSVISDEITFSENPITKSKESGLELVTIGNSQSTFISGENANGNKTSGEVKDPNIAIQDINKGDINKELEKLNSSSSNENALPQSTSGLAYYYAPSISELHKDAAKKGDYRKFKDVMLEMDPSLDYTILYDYLEKAGAFHTVNTGGVKVGDEVEFIIDSDLDAALSQQGKYEPIILMRLKKTGQIIGVVGSSPNTMKKYANLATFRKLILDEYYKKGLSENSSIFTASITSNVNQVLLGVLPVIDREVKVKDIPGLSATPLFAVIQNGAFVTNGKIKNSDITHPLDMSNKEGRLYILVPNAKGKYSPVPVRADRFNMQELNLENQEFINTVLGKELLTLFQELSRAEDIEMVRSVLAKLKEILYIRDVHVFPYDNKQEKGFRIVHTLRNADGSLLKKTVNGKVVNHENNYFIPIAKKMNDNSDGDVVAVIGATASNTDVNTEESIVENVIYNNILNAFYAMNLPFQINTNLINSTGYNSRIINSGIVHTNLEKFEVLNSWFTIDYLGNDGKIVKAEKIENQKPNEKKPEPKPLIPGEVIVFNNVKYNVDLVNNKIYNSQGKEVVLDNPKLLFDLAWSQKNIGNIQNNNYNIYNNQVLLPDGSVLNRTTGKYLNEEEAKVVKSILVARQQNKIATDEILADIELHQSLVDRSKTTDKSYFIFEGGKYVEYQRVHTLIGSNYNTDITDKQSFVIDKIKKKLVQLSNNVSNYNTYLEELSAQYADVSAYKNKVDLKSRKAIVNIIENQFKSSLQESLINGSTIDSIVRDFFNKGKLEKPSNMTQEAFNSLLENLNKIQETLNKNGEIFLANNIVLFHKFSDNLRVAGEVDILAVTPDGDFKIYDIKTSKYSFYDTLDSRGNVVNYFKTKSDRQTRSTEEQYRLQLSAYKVLFENQYKKPITSLGILPIVITPKNSIITNVKMEKGIKLQFNPNVPLIQSPIIEKPTKSVEKPKEQPKPGAIIKEGVSALSEAHNMPDAVVGEYINNKNEVIKTYIKYLDTVEGIPVYIRRVPNYSKGNSTTLYIAYYSYHIVLPNGKSISIIQQAKTTDSEEFIKELVVKALTKSKETINKLKSLASEKTVLSNKVTPEIVNTKKEEIKEEPKISTSPKVTNIEDVVVQTESKFKGKRKSITPKMDIQENVGTKKELIDGTKEQVPKDLVNKKVNKDLSFEALTKLEQDQLLLQGWTIEKYNSISNKEKKKALDCAGVL